MKIMMTLTLLTTSVVGFAQARNNVQTRILKNVDQIKEELPYTTASRKDLREALKLIQEAKRIVVGRTFPQPMPPRQPSFNYRCIDKDNDNRAPYVYSYVDQNFNVIKIADFKFASMSSCERSLTSRINVIGADIMCIAKDGDDRAPFVATVVNMDGSFKVIKTTLFASMKRCEDSFTTGVVANGKYAFCTDKDSDNRAPYMINSFDPFALTISRMSSSLFNSMNDCQNVLYSQRH